MGNNVYNDGNFVWANSPDKTFGLNVSTVGAIPSNPALTNSWHNQQAQGLSETLPVAAVGAGSVAFTGLTTLGKAVSGAALGGGFDAAGQWVTTGEIQPMKTFIAAGTGALAAPFASTSVMRNAGVGGLVGGGNTALGNAWYGTDDSVLYGGFTGGIFSGLGTMAGTRAKNLAAEVMPNNIGGQPINPKVPILLQNFGVPNPWPARIGNTVEQGISNVPSMLPAKSEEKKR
jgi:hypothetical protein